MNLSRRELLKWLAGLTGVALLLKLPDISAEVEAEPEDLSSVWGDWTETNPGNEIAPIDLYHVPNGNWVFDGEGKVGQPAYIAYNDCFPVITSDKEFVHPKHPDPIGIVLKNQGDNVLVQLT